MLTEEEIYDRLGTDSDGTPITLDLQPKNRFEEAMWNERLDAKIGKRASEREKTAIEKKIKEGYRIDSARADTPDGARLFRVRVPVSI